MKSNFTAALCALAWLAFATLAPKGFTQVVTNTSDSGSGTLRDAINTATNNATITFTTNLSGATITLASTLTINTNLTIDASALTSSIQINGNNSVEIFNIATNITVVLTSLTITNGQGYYASNGHGYGGGIYNGGMLTLNDCTVSGNFAQVGGGIYSGFIGFTGEGTTSSATLTVNQCTFFGNWGREGGGIVNVGGELTVNQCTLFGNTSPNTGYVMGIGGGIINYSGTLTVNQSTLFMNQADSAGGSIWNEYGGCILFNSIVAGNAEDNIYGAFTNVGANLTNADPILAMLGSYGGPTQTCPPLPGSPAIGAGSVAGNTFTNDQRGYARTQNGLIDIGAVESPTLQFAASPTNSLIGLDVQFNSPGVDSDGTVITQWNWSFGDGNSSTVQSPANVYVSVGGFNPSLTVTNSLGLTLAAFGPAITVSPPIGIYAVSLSGNNLELNGSNGVSGLAYYILMTTNLSLPTIQWTPVATNIWSANGVFNLTITNAVNPSVPNQFYQLQVP